MLGCWLLRPLTLSTQHSHKVNTHPSESATNFVKHLAADCFSRTVEGELPTVDIVGKEIWTSGSWADEDMAWRRNQTLVEIPETCCPGFGSSGI